MHSKDTEYRENDTVELLFRVSHLLKRAFNIKLEEYDLPPELTGERMRVMMEVLNQDGIKMNELARKLDIKARTVTAYIDSIEKIGYIRRSPDPDDRRATRLHLTDLALSRIEDFGHAMQQASRDLLSGLSTAQQMELFDLLSMLYDDQNLHI